jgi:hypothetical protein
MDNEQERSTGIRMTRGNNMLSFDEMIYMPKGVLYVIVLKRREQCQTRHCVGKEHSEVVGDQQITEAGAAITCSQKNLTRLLQLITMIKGDYFDSGFNEFVSTNATPEQCWDKLGETITFYSTKQYFFVAGKGLTNVAESTVLSKAVTHLGQTTSLHALLASKKISSRWTDNVSPCTPCPCFKKDLEQVAAKSSANTMTQQSSIPKGNRKSSTHTHGSWPTSLAWAKISLNN